MIRLNRVYFKIFRKVPYLISREIVGGDNILDVGCGRSSVLKRVRIEDRMYKVGIDIYEPYVKQVIESNVYDEVLLADARKLPFEAESFDCVVLGSVFTHLLSEDIENYLSEIARVLKKGGRSLITFFLLNKESLELINAGKSTLDFEYEHGKYRTINPNMPEDAVCFDEPYILSLYEKCGLKIQEPIRYGCWCERQDFLSYQDIVVAIKT